jgi:hypothetical protein
LTKFAHRQKMCLFEDEKSLIWFYANPTKRCYAVRGK